MTTIVIPHGVKARRDPHGRGWIAEYHGPDGIGFRTVEEPKGIVKLHPSPIAAERAATAALLEALTARTIRKSQRAKATQIRYVGKRAVMVAAR